MLEVNVKTTNRFAFLQDGMLYFFVLHFCDSNLTSEASLSVVLISFIKMMTRSLRTNKSLLKKRW